jgi:hypothetical protein
MSEITCTLKMLNIANALYAREIGALFNWACAPDKHSTSSHRSHRIDPAAPDDLCDSKGPADSGVFAVPGRLARLSSQFAALPLRLCRHIGVLRLTQGSPETGAADQICFESEDAEEDDPEVEASALRGRLSSLAHVGNELGRYGVIHSRKDLDTSSWAVPKRPHSS